MHLQLSIHKRKANNALTLVGIGYKKTLPTSFFPVTSINIGISSQSVLTFTCNSMTHWCTFWRPYLVPVINHWTWIKTTRQKAVFLVKSLWWNWSFDNFSNRKARVSKLWSHDQIGMHYITRPPSSNELFIHKIKCFHQDTATPKSRIQRVRVEKEKNSYVKEFSGASNKVATSDQRNSHFCIAKGRMIQRISKKMSNRYKLKVKSHISL